MIERQASGLAAPKFDLWFGSLPANASELGTFDTRHFFLAKSKL
jgi:hypothetical protein